MIFLYIIDSILMILGGILITTYENVNDRPLETLPLVASIILVRSIPLLGLSKWD
jgi:hypothetical protein